MAVRSSLPREQMIRGFLRKQKGRGKKITEDDPRWVQQLAHGQGQEHKVGANITRPYGYVGKKR